MHNHNCLIPTLLRLCVFGLVLLADRIPVLAQEPGTVTFRVNDQQSLPLPCRIHLKDERGLPVKVAGYPYWHDHFVCDGNASIELPPGNCQWEIERGPEYSPLSGTTVVASGSQSSVEVTLKRIANLNNEGWYSGDLHVHRPVVEIKRLMRAEDLNFAPVIGWWNTPATNAERAAETEFRFDGNRIYCTEAGEDEREGGALLYFGLSQPLDLTVKSREFPSPMRFVQQARKQNRGVWIDIEKPFWWDTPMWLASGQMNSIGLANNHMNRLGMLSNEAWGLPRDLKRLPNPRGNGFWTQEIYYQILNCGIRIPPSAGSASGVLNNPVGYNRVYVHLGRQEFTGDNWFAALQSGRCFVTNGPLLRAKANGEFSGAEFRLDGDAMTVQFEIQLTSNDRIRELEFIHNGDVVQRVACRNETDQRMKAKLRITQPGWVLIRAIADVDHTFRFASTAPWYINGDGDEVMVSRESVDFFLDWVNERIERIKANVADGPQRESILRWHAMAREYWRKQREVSFPRE